MNEQGKSWFDGLKALIAECRSEAPLVERANLTHAQEMQCRIIGGSLISWLRKYGPPLLQERAVLSGMEEWEKDPFIVFTSDEPGLVAAREILDPFPENIAFLFPKEFDDWKKRNPDEGYRWHVHTWSWFVPLDAKHLKEAERFPLGSGESFWLHKEGTMCGRHFGRGGDHLWKWNGHEPELLKECFDQWVS